MIRTTFFYIYESDGYRLLKTIYYETNNRFLTIFFIIVWMH
jgi:hypothetical protein